MGINEQSAGEVLLAWLREKTATLTDFEGPARRDEDDAVHRMRVATRTLRSTLKTFGTLFDAAAAEHLNTELRWLGTVLGGVRDVEVQEAQLANLLADLRRSDVHGPVRRRIEKEFAPRRAAARKDLLAALDSDRYAALVQGLADFVADPPFTPLATEPGLNLLPPYVDRARRRFRRRMRHAQPLERGEERDLALHQARKAARQTRYAAEAVAPLFGTKARHLAKDMETLQTLLGAHHDRIVLGETLDQLVDRANHAGENASTYRKLQDNAKHEARKFDAKAHKAWKQMGSARRPDWLR